MNYISWNDEVIAVKCLQSIRESWLIIQTQMKNSQNIISISFSMFEIGHLLCPISNIEHCVFILQKGEYLPVFVLVKEKNICSSQVSKFEKKNLTYPVISEQINFLLICLCINLMLFYSYYPISSFFS